jgi:hypothetical protein
MQNESILRHQIDAVRFKDMEELREQFQALYGFDCGDTTVRHLRKRIIYRLQELFYGGVSDTDLELLDRIADKDPVANLKRSRKMNPMRIAGTKLFRVYRGRQYEFTIVRDKEFVFNGETYKSLSAIARKITGMRWNGKQFFGVKS